MRKSFISSLPSLFMACLFAALLIYCILSIKELKTTIINNPYPFVYDKPKTSTSNTIYKGGELNEFTKMLDDLADSLD